MTIFHCEGFETIGNTATSGADLETRIGKIDRYTWQEVSGGHTDPIQLVDDFETDGNALRLPLGLASRESYIRHEWPTAYKVTTNSSHPEIAIGFRMYNADMNPGAARKIWQYMTAATSPSCTLGVASNGVDLTWNDPTGTVTISGVLTVDTWHYIEAHFKPTTSAAGGFVIVYVDGTEVYNSGARTLVTFTFSASYGTRIGLGSSDNEVGSNRPILDDWYELEVDGVTHTGRLGSVRIKRLTPSSDATPNDWSPASGADNYAMVDGVDWGTSDYVEAAATAEDDHYGLSALAGADQVHALQVDVVCVAVDGTPTLHVGFDNGTADESSEGVIGTVSSVCKRALFTTDPSGAAWSQASANSVEATQRMTE